MKGSKRRGGPVKILDEVVRNDRLGKADSEMILLTTFRGTNGDTLSETRLKWFGHIQHMPTMTPLRKVFIGKVNSLPRRIDRPNKTWMKVVKIDMKKCKLFEDLTLELG